MLPWSPRSEAVRTGLSALFTGALSLAATRARSTWSSQSVPHVTASSHPPQYDFWDLLSVHVVNNTQVPWSMVGMGILFEPTRRLVRATRLDTIHAAWHPGSAGMHFGWLPVVKHIGVGESVEVQCHCAPERRWTDTTRARVLHVKLAEASGRRRYAANIVVRLHG